MGRIWGETPGLSRATSQAMNEDQIYQDLSNNGVNPSLPISSVEDSEAERRKETTCSFFWRVRKEENVDCCKEVL